MKIAQIAPLLTEELVRQGHDVTLFASGDSITAAELVAPSRNFRVVRSRVEKPSAMSARRSCAHASFDCQPYYPRPGTARL
jgi:hypothetical protein